MATTAGMSTQMQSSAVPMILVPIGDASLQPYTVSTAKPTLLGRQSHCDIQLPDQSVSREHCSIECRRGGWFVSDRTSRQGTLLNGAKLEPGRPTPLDHGDLIGIARWSFRVQLGSVAPMPMPGTTFRMAESEGRVQTVRSEELLSRAERQLSLVMNLAAGLHSATDEVAVAQVIVKALAEGTGYRRAAMVKPIGSSDAVTVLGSIDGGREAAVGFPVSKSLIRAASGGEVATLTADSVLRHAVSIMTAGVRTAVCAPIIVAGNVVAFAYIDNADREAPTHTEPAPFIAAVAHLAGLAMAELSRRALDDRHRRLEGDLHAARHAQERLMPAPGGTIGGVRYAFRNIPGRLVAGDLADVIDLGGGRVAVFLGDVSGKGVGAAMLMAAAQTQLRAALRDEPDLAEAVSKVNREVVTRLASGEFISLWVGVIDGPARTLCYVDAGHGYWLSRSGTEVCRGPQPQCMPLGISADEDYRSTTVPLAPGDRIVVFSDGVVEQHGADEGEQFRIEGAVAALAGAADELADVGEILRALQEYAGSESLADDVTVLSVSVGI